MANSVQVHTPVTIRVYPYPSQDFEEDDIVQPSSPFYWALVHAGFANDSGIPEEPAPPVDVATPVFSFGAPNDDEMLCWDDDLGLWVPKPKKGLLNFVENGTGQTIAFTTVATLCAGMILEVPPSETDVRINWGAWLGTGTGGQGAIYTQLYEFTDTTALQKEAMLTFCCTDMPVTSQAAVHRSSWRIPPSDEGRTYGLYGVVVREAGSSLAAYFRNLVNTFGKTWMSAEAV